VRFFDCRKAIRFSIGDPATLGSWRTARDISIERKGSAVESSHMSPRTVSSVEAAKVDETYGRSHKVFTNRHA
jgi:hypothetical protein